MEFDTDYIDVLILGCGISGLTSAYKLKEKDQNLKIIMLEASSTLGGQLSSANHDESVATYISEDHYHIIDLLKKFDIETNVLEKSGCPVENITQNILKNECWIKRKLVNFEIYLLLNRIDLLCTSYDPGRFRISKNDPTVENFISRNLIFEHSRKILRNFVRIVCGTASNNIKLPEFLSICNSGGGFKKILDLYIKSGLSLQRLITFSAKKLIEKFEVLVNDIHILRNAKVTDIFHYPDYVVIKEHNGKVFNASVLILAVPWNSLEDINIFPSIPKELRTPKFYVKNYITFYVLSYHNLQLFKKFNFCGTFVSLEQPVVLIREYSTTELVVIVLHNHFEFGAAFDYSILQKLSDNFGDEMLLPKMLRKKTFEQNLLLNLPTTTPWNRVIFSSTTAATSYRGCISGAVQSGYRAAINTLLIIRPQNVSWRDLDQIQKARPLKLQIARWEKILSETNLFNCSIISFGICAILLYVTIKALKFSK